jgi:hypothetical protein
METETTPAPSLLGRLYRLPSDVLVGVVRLYQIFLSPIFGRACRYDPTCSHYFIGAVRKYGAVRGSLRGIWRICRCHPFHRGGYDPP